MARASQQLTVSGRVEVRRQRLLPVRGEVFVSEGEEVGMNQPVARALLPGPLHPLNVAATLGVSPPELHTAMLVKEGDRLSLNQCIAETASVFGLLRRQVLSPIDGTVDAISKTTGVVMLRALPRPLEVKAYIPGTVAEVIADVGVELSARVAQVQGIFGIGGEVFGPLALVAARPGETLSSDRITEAHRGAIVVGSGRVTLVALRRMIELGVRCVVSASASGADLIDLVGATLNPASTGNEDVGLTIVLTEGFGDLSMSEHTFELLSALDGREVSANGTTQIRAGVLRPEIIAPPLDGAGSRLERDETITTGSRVRIIRGEEFGRIGRVQRIPENPRPIASGATALVFEVDLEKKGETVIVPRPNVELLAR